MKLFTNHREAVFVRRPNRFLIIARDGEEEIPCHCPNPGRLIEFFGPRGSDIPGIRLILERRSGDPAGGAGPSKAKTAYTAVGLYYRDTVVPLFSSRANKAAEALILHHLIPGIKEITREYVIGSSRFDFLCIDGEGTRHLIEVKACSLIEYGTAMFPDAPSERALKHLEELADLAGKGFCCHVLFVIVHGKPRVFIPNLHTDPLFAAALSRYGIAAGPKGPPPAAPDRGVHIHAALLRCDKAGNGTLAAKSVPVDLSHGELAGSDSGNYLILLELPEERDIPIGALGTVHFSPGWYVYAGSARKNLRKRISRHLRKVRKQKHWHLDYLSPAARVLKGFPVMSYRNLECALAGALKAIGGEAIPGFGSSDCRCGSHLYYFADPPLQNRAFWDMLLRFQHKTGLRRG
ncbi:MAG: DNA/RNA nuclease SfsA [Treponema sp.]|nr:DNA/RNA nuclease SfsA [Treponema sp.]